WWGSHAELRVRLMVESSNPDDLPANNVITCVPVASDAMSALVVGGQVGAELHQFLAAQGFVVSHVEAPAQVPLDQLASYELLLLTSLHDRMFGGDRDRRLLERMTALGGTILVCGQQKAFGPGAYVGGPLETVLPVNVAPKNAPPMAHLLLLDASAT